MPVLVTRLRLDRHAERGVEPRRVLSSTISGMSSSSSRSSVIGMQIRPRPCFAMKLIASGVTFSAAIVRSPSFSRSSSSTTMIISPSRMASMASSIGGERRLRAACACRHLRSLICPSSSIMSDRARDATYLPRMSHSRLTSVARLSRARRFVCCPRERDDLHVEAPIVHAGDRQADAVHARSSPCGRCRARASGGNWTVSQ